ncbi:MAG: response regulator [Candidatus Peribacteraceae bacterium]|nr:response regulator [Candidatus Peribacteraceae bacterium]
MSRSYILLAEDDPVIGEMIRLALEEGGENVVHVRDGAEAIAAVERQSPALLLLDLLMPKMDGFRVLERMREGGYGVRTVILSNLSDEKSRDRCMALGAIDFIVKSNIDEEFLVDLVRKHRQVGQ